MGQAGKRNQYGVVAAAAAPDHTKVILGVVAVVLIAVAVVGGVIYTRSQKNITEDKAITVATASLDAPVKRDGGVVEVGQDDAKATLDVYEDFLCPACAAFESRYGAAIDDKIKSGSLKVRFHMLDMLNDRSDPAGYSRDSANAALLAADEGKFLSFHKSLFGDQPAEGARGWSKDQLIKLGRALGVSSSAFVDGVRSGKYDTLVSAEFEKASTDPALERDYGGGQRGFGTPTLASGGKVIDTSDPNWLTALTG